MSIYKSDAQKLNELAINRYIEKLFMSRIKLLPLKERTTFALLKKLFKRFKSHYNPESVIPNKQPPIEF